MKKLRSNKGFTLAELLVSFLIMSLLGMMVAGGISHAGQVRRQAVSFSEANLLASTLTEAAADELRFARNIRGTGADVSFDSERYGADCRLQATDGRLTAGGLPLVAERAYTEGLRVGACTVAYVGQKFQLSLTIVNEADEVLARVGSETEGVHIAPLNP